MDTTADFKNGLCIKHNKDIWKIESFQHVKPGKGPAFVRTKIRNLNTGKVLENTFTAGVKIEIIRIENRASQFLYKESDSYCISIASLKDTRLEILSTYSFKLDISSVTQPSLLLIKHEWPNIMSAAENSPIK